MGSAAIALGSFREIEARYSCVFPAGDEPDPAVVRAIREICPNYVPMWVARAFQTPPGGLHVAKYHVLATWQMWPTDEYVTPVRAERPYGFPFHGGVLFAQRPWSIAWPDKSWQRQVNFPEQGLPYDREVWWFVRQVYGELGVPFGTWAAGEMHAAGRKFNANQALIREVKQDELKQVQENARLELRDRVSNSPTAMRDYETWKDAILQDKPERILKEVEPKGFAEVRAAEPPAA